MLTKKNQIEFIAIKLAHLKACVATLNAVRFFDLNVAAEDFFAKLLNEVFAFSLVNLNHDNQNKAAIDLGDKASGIAFQVTSERTKFKIQKTIDKFEEKGLSNDYDKLRVLIIGDRTGDYPRLIIPNGITFSGKSDVLDISDLMKVIDTLDLAKLKRIVDLMHREIAGHPAVTAIQKQSDFEALDEIRAHFDRPAFHDDWQVECNYQAFQLALTQLIKLLNTGMANGKLVAKKRSDFQNQYLRDGLELVYRKLTTFRSLFLIHVRSGEINLDQNCCQFHDPKMIDAFNSFKSSVIDELNQVLAAGGKQPLPRANPIPIIP